MKELGTRAPDFKLKDVVTGASVTRRDVAGPKGMLVMFICRRCPFVKHVQSELAAIGRDYHGRGVGIVAISANDVASHPEDSPTKLVSGAGAAVHVSCCSMKHKTWRARDAQCTQFPSRGGALVYPGQLDDSRPGNEIPVTAGFASCRRRDPPTRLPGARPGIGCNIKWR
jgi:hypothetical protein